MRHVFIINTVAGKHNVAGSHVPEIESFFAANPAFGTPEIVYTQAHGHATEIAREYACAGEPVRLYALGGDGTIAEVLRGMYPYPNAQLACMPCGSGNDYLRTFPDCDFSNLPALVSGQAHPVDLIRCGDDISLNIACMGMDADVAAKMKKYKHLPLVSGSMAYNLAVADVFFHRLGKDLSITLETTHGTVHREGRYFFALAASGQYYGGGYRGAPMARPDDGLLDFVLVKAMSRPEVLRFLPAYKKGTLGDNPYVEHFRGTEMHVVCAEGAAVALDGECFTGNDLCFKLHDRTVSFVLPANGGVKQELIQRTADTHVSGQRLRSAFVKKV